MSGFHNELIRLAQIKKGVSILLPDAGCGLNADLIFGQFKPSELQVHLVEENGEHVKKLMDKYYGGSHLDIIFYHPEEEYSFLMNNIRITKYNFIRFGNGFGDCNYDRVIYFQKCSLERILHMVKLTKNGGVVITPVDRNSNYSDEIEGKIEYIESEYLIRENIRILKVTK